MAALFTACMPAGMAGPGSSGDPVVVMETSMGNIFIQLFEREAPVGTANFLEYVKSGFYDGLIFHRVINGFVIQGGGYDAALDKRDPRDPIINEATNGLRNLRGMLSYARTDVVNSATSQFFINLENNRSLDHRSNTPLGFGYAVFGKVVRGMAVADEIAKVRVTKMKGMTDVPAVPVVIQKAYVFEQ
ncbi:peptidylprolyl isomerase [bacterium]|nr:peptidylprolyl isomerase [bacterium]